MNLPDFEAWAIFAKVIECGSFSRAGEELALSKATISKAITRLETRLGVRLIQRTSRRIALTDFGRQSLGRAQRMLVEAEAADIEARTCAKVPGGLVRLTAPVYFGIEHVVPLLPALFAAYPALTIDLHLSDQTVDLVADGFDLAVRIAALSDSSLRVRRLCDVSLLLVGAPGYFSKNGRPTHPRDLADHRCFAYTYKPDPHRWHFRAPSGETAAVLPRGPMRANSGEAVLPLLRQGCGIALLPEFLVLQDLEAGLLQSVMCDWQSAPIALNLVMPPGNLRPARVTVVLDHLARHLAAAAWARRVPPENEAVAP
jgi:DNA-binding transcriptional LysR family regulator